MSVNVNRYSRLGFCCVLTSGAKIAWSDDNRVFKKILASKGFKEAFEASSADLLSFEHKLTVDGVRFMIVCIPVPGNRYVCTAYPEIIYMKQSYSEMYARIFNIRRSAGKDLSLLVTLEEKLKEISADEGCFDLLKEMYACAEEIISDSDGICRLFDAEHLSGYVDLKDSINSTFAAVRKYNALMRRDIRADVQLERCVARVNYTVLETLLLETVRILYKLLPENGSSLISVKGGKDGALVIKTERLAATDIDPGALDSEIRDIRCATECLGGSVKISSPEEGFMLKVVLPVSLSNYTGRVKKDIGEMPGEELRGYYKLFEPRRDSGSHIEFNNERIEPVLSITLLLADLLLGELAGSGK